MAVDSLANLLLAEAGGKTASERYVDMLNIMSTIANRAEATGRPIADIIAADGEFSAWGKPLPPGVEKYAHLAQRAIEQVAQHGSVTRAQFYATPAAANNLPKGLKAEGRTAGHQFYSDPQGRAIETTGGYVKPMPINLDVTAALPLDAPRPYSPNTFQPQLVAPQLPDLGNVPARSVATTQVAPPMSMPAPSVPTVPVISRSITPGAGLANLAPNGIQERGTREGLSFIGDRQVFPGIGMGNLAPFNDRVALASGLEPDQFAFTPGNRGLYPASGIAQKVANAADDVLPGVKTTLYSGQERKGQAPVGDSVDRHPRGYAGDFNFTKDGRAVSDPAFFQDLSLEMAARHDANIGYSAGRDYMGPERAHFDTMPLGVGLPGGAQWGATANAWAPELQFARDAGRTLPGWGASRNEPIPTPTPRDIGLTLPAVPPSIPNFAGGLSPRAAQEASMPSAMSAVPMPSPQIGGTPGPAPVAMPSPAMPTNPAFPAVPMPGPQLGPFAPSPASFSGGLSPRRGQEESMAMHRLGLPEPAALPFAAEPNRAGPFAPAFPGGPITMAPPSPGGMPSLPAPALPAPPSVPQSVIDAYTEYGRSRAAAPATPSLPAVPSSVLAPPMAPPQVMAPPINLPPAAPIPAPSPRSPVRDVLRGGIFGPATAQIGRNVRSNLRGQPINVFAGIKDRYRGLGAQMSNMFAAPAVAQFNAGTGLGAIQGLLSGQFGPGAVAYSASNPGASWSVNGAGFNEFTSGHGFSGRPPGDF